MRPTILLCSKIIFKIIMTMGVGWGGRGRWESCQENGQEKLLNILTCMPLWSICTFHCFSVFYNSASYRKLILKQIILFSFNSQYHLFFLESGYN